MKAVQILIGLSLILDFSPSMAIGQDNDNSDVNLIAFVLSAPCESAPIAECPINIKIMNPDNGSYILLDVGSVEPTTIQFLPDKHSISYLTYDGAYHVVDLISLEKQFSLQFSPMLRTSLLWSPTSNLVAIRDKPESVAWTNLYLLDTQSWELKQIIENLDVRGGLDWSPDGTKLLFSASERDEWSTADIYMLDIATLEYTNITQNPGNNYSPSWSSDGKRFAFTSGKEKPDHITIMEGDNIWKTFDFSDSWVGGPEWVLNDTYLTYVINGETGSILYMIQIRNGEITQLAHGKPLSGHDISADGEKLVYLTTRPDSSLCIVNLRTSHESCFPDETPFFWGVPSWSR